MSAVRFVHRVARLFREDGDPPRLSFGSWGELQATVAAVCHPDWRGVRTATFGHRVPVVEVRDAGAHSEELAERLETAGVTVVVVQGFPPGSERLIERAKAKGLQTRVVLHSSMVQHGAEPGEAQVVTQILGLLQGGALDKLGFVKEGQAEAFRALGYQAAWVPNRLPPLPEIEPVDLGHGLHIGIFAEPFWRKNVVTQLGAVALMEGIAHVIHRPDVSYLESLRVVEHGLLPYDVFLGLLGSVDLNLYVTLSESYPLSPLESYAAGVPCLVSRTSSLFRDDPRLWELSTLDRLDDPAAVAEAGRRLLDHREEAVHRGREWIERWDRIAARHWEEFVA